MMSNSYLFLVDEDTRVSGLYGDVWTTLQEVLRFRAVYKRYYPSAISNTMNSEVLLTMSSVKQPSPTFNEHSSIIGENSYSLFALLENTYVTDWWYTQIFDVYTWILSIFFIVALSFIMMGIYKLQKTWCKESERNCEFVSPAFNLICVLGATSGQGFQKMPSSWSLRMCAFTALIMGMLIFCGFNSILTSYLALPCHNIETNSLDHVLKEGTHSLCIRRKGPAYDGICETMRRSDTLKNMRKNWEDLIRSDCPDIERGLKAKNSVCKPGFVYVLTSDALFKRYQHIQGKCQIMKISGSYWFSTRSFLHYRSVKYREPINIYLLRLRSAGILKYLRLKWLNQELEDTYFYSVHRVEFGQVQMILISLLIMVIVSSVICVLENMWFELSLKKLQQKL